MHYLLLSISLVHCEVNDWFGGGQVWSKHMTAVVHVASADLLYRFHFNVQQACLVTFICKKGADPSPPDREMLLTSTTVGSIVCQQVMLQWMQDLGELDGVCTFCEMAVPLVARIAETLGLPGNSPAAVDAARDKHSTRATMAAAGLPTPRNMLIQQPSDIGAAAEKVKFPAGAKLHTLCTIMLSLPCNDQSL